MKLNHKLRRNSTNVSEESDMCSEIEENIDIETDRDEQRIPIALRLMRPELDTHEQDKERRHFSKCSNYLPDCESNIAQRLMRPDFRRHSKDNDEAKQSLSKCSNNLSVCESKQITRPSFLITDILSDKKKHCESVQFVPNTPTSLNESLNNLDSHHRIEGVPHRTASIIHSPTSGSESPDYSDDGKYIHMFLLSLEIILIFRSDLPAKYMIIFLGLTCQLTGQT